MNFEVLPLFSFPVAVMDLDEDFSNIENSIDDIKFRKINKCEMNSSQNCYIANSSNFLTNFSKEKEILLHYFYEYKDNVLGLKSIDFLITSSWMNKIEDGGYGHYHFHTNSIYSCILYFDSYNSGELMFYNPFPVTFELEPDDDVDDTVYNSHKWMIEPRKNRMIIFPSQLHHQVLKNTSGKSRYSLAFNLFPYGKFGETDSALNIQHV